MTSKITTNSQLSTTEPKNQKQTKETSRTGMESQKWRSHGSLSVERGRGCLLYTSDAADDPRVV